MTNGLCISGCAVRSSASLRSHPTPFTHHFLSTYLTRRSSSFAPKKQNTEKQIVVDFGSLFISRSSVSRRRTDTHRTHHQKLERERSLVIFATSSPSLNKSVLGHIHNNTYNRNRKQKSPRIDTRQTQDFFDRQLITSRFPNHFLPPSKLSSSQRIKNSFIGVFSQAVSNNPYLCFNFSFYETRGIF